MINLQKHQLSPPGVHLVHPGVAPEDAAGTQRAVDLPSGHAHAVAGVCHTGSVKTRFDTMF